MDHILHNWFPALLANCTNNWQAIIRAALKERWQSPTDRTATISNIIPSRFYLQNVIYNTSRRMENKYFLPPLGINHVTERDEGYEDVDWDCIVIAVAVTCSLALGAVLQW